jgi:hypothetical protein
MAEFKFSLFLNLIRRYSRKSDFQFYFSPILEL